MESSRALVNQLILELLSVTPMSLFKMNAILAISKKLKNPLLKDLDFVKQADGAYCLSVAAELSEMERAKDVACEIGLSRGQKIYILEEKKLTIVRPELRALTGLTEPGLRTLLYRRLRLGSYNLDEFLTF